jgi:hypothetical protein
VGCRPPRRRDAQSAIPRDRRDLESGEAAADNREAFAVTQASAETVCVGEFPEVVDVPDRAEAHLPGTSPGGEDKPLVRPGTGSSVDGHALAVDPLDFRPRVQRDVEVEQGWSRRQRALRIGLVVGEEGFRQRQLDPRGAPAISSGLAAPTRAVRWRATRMVDAGRVPR